MEAILILFGIIIFLYFINYLSNKSTHTQKIKEIKSTQKTNSSVPTTPTIKNALVHAEKARTGELLDRLKDHEITELPRQEVHHVHHVHVTHEWKSKNTEDENKDHTAAVWERLGYQVKAGESYSYKHYGREIFTPNQVIKAGQYRNRIASSGLSEKQLKVKTLGLALVESTGSKRAAKDILVNDYGFSENTAKYAVGYRGYDDY